MRSSLLASINLAVMFVGCVFLSGAIARAHWRKCGAFSVILLIIVCGQLWLIPQAVSFFAFESTRLLYPLWFGNWMVLAFGVTVLCLTLRGSSRDLSDAALMDGTGFFATYRHVIWPTMKPALLILALLLVMASWSEFARALAPSIIAGPGEGTLPATTPEIAKGLIFSLLATLPLIAIFFISRQQLANESPAGTRKR